MHCMRQIGKLKTGEENGKEKSSARGCHQQPCGKTHERF